MNLVRNRPNTGTVSTTAPHGSTVTVSRDKPATASPLAGSATGPQGGGRLTATVVTSDRARGPLTEATFEKSPRATPTATSSAGSTTIMGTAKDAVTTYFSSKTNVATASLSATGAGLTTAKLALRGLPVVGSLVNAASAVVSMAKACVRTAAYANNEKNIDRTDIAMDWAKVATDVAGIFFPPVGLAGSLGATAYTVYDAVSDYNSNNPAPASPDKPAHRTPA